MESRYWYSFHRQGEDEEEPKGKKAKMSNNAKGKAPSPKKNAKKWTAWAPRRLPAARRPTDPRLTTSSVTRRRRRRAGGALVVR